MDALYLQKQIDHLEDRVGGMQLRVDRSKKKIGLDDPLETLESRLKDFRKGLSYYQGELAKLS